MRHVQKLMEMKKYLENDEIQLLALTEYTLSKLKALTDDEFKNLELHLDLNISDSISDFCGLLQKSSIGCAPDGN